MSAFNLLFLFVLTLACRSLAGKVRAGLKWVNSGGSVAIHCSVPITSPDSLILERGLNQDENVVYLANTGKSTVGNGFKHRLHHHGDLTMLSVTIKNLTVEDTGAYWCMYTHFDSATDVLNKKKGQGSVLLVVNGSQCNEEDHGIPMNLVLVSALTAGSVLLLTLIIIFLWIIPKVKARRATMKPNPPRTSDVYEEMRATLRH